MPSIDCILDHKDVDLVYYCFVIKAKIIKDPMVHLNDVITVSFGITALSKITMEQKSKV